MILITYKDDAIDTAETMPMGGALCGRGIDAVLFDAQDFDNIAEMLGSDSVHTRDRMTEYLSNLTCRFGPGKQSHKAILGATE